MDEPSKKIINHGPNHTIMTILCDSGMRHLSKFYNAEYLSQYGFTPKPTGLEFLGLRGVSVT
jgi:cysteine synthase A